MLLLLVCLRAQVARTAEATPMPPARHIGPCRAAVFAYHPMRSVCGAPQRRLACFEGRPAQRLLRIGRRRATVAERASNGVNGAWPSF